MYEPIFVPKMKNHVLSLGGTRFLATHSSEYRSPDDMLDEPLHIHAQTEIFFLVEGCVSFFVSDRLRKISVGDIVISRANEVHRCICESAGIFDHYCLWIDSMDPSELLGFLCGEDAPTVLSFDIAERERILSIFKRLAKEREVYDPLEETCDLLSLISAIKNKGTKKGREAALPKAMSDVLDDINENYTTLKNLSELTERHFISSATLSRWFREHLQVSPREYIESKKLSHALRLLLSGTSVTDACMLSGFSDCSHFIMLFKKKFGQTPLKYKETHRQI